jgi:hypothetical protein
LSQLRPIQALLPSNTFQCIFLHLCQCLPMISFHHIYRRSFCLHYPYLHKYSCTQHCFFTEVLGNIFTFRLLYLKGKSPVCIKVSRKVRSAC